MTLLGLLGPGALARAETLTEDRVIDIARARDPRSLAARAAVSVAEAEEVRAGLYPNPTVGWEREHGAATEDSFVLTVPLEITGRRAAETAAARSSASSVRARAAQTQSEVVRASLDLFYEAVAAEREVQIAERAVEKLDEAARVLARRHEEGTTSGYERGRLELEAELARSDLRLARARARAARTTLAAWLALDVGALELRGDLATHDPAPAQAGARRERPSIASLRTAEAEARDARESASWAWVPTLSASGGLRIAEENETRLGYVAGLTLSVPLFSRGQEVRAESAARRELAVAELRAAEHGARVEGARARERLVSARDELARLTEGTRERVELLERAVQSGYREGHRTVVELVDAQRARTEVERRGLELELAAKRAELDLRAARGELE